MANNTTILINTKCELMVSPRESLAEEGYTYVEFLVGDSVDSISTLVISEEPELFKYYLSEDGLYVYYRLKIINTNNESSLEELGENRIHFNEDTKKLMIGSKELEDSAQLETIINSDSPNLLGVIDMLEEPVFSICKVSTCLENLQRKYIFSGSHVGGSCKNDTDKNLRDFLFSTVFILKLLIRQQRYEEALKILKSINTCGLCNSYMSPRNSCNCR